jgi:hypothetical protein
LLGERRRGVGLPASASAGRGKKEGERGMQDAGRKKDPGHVFGVGGRGRAQIHGGARRKLFNCGFLCVFWFASGERERGGRESVSENGTKKIAGLFSPILPPSRPGQACIINISPSNAHLICAAHLRRVSAGSFSPPRLGSRRFFWRGGAASRSSLLFFFYFFSSSRLGSTTW